MHWLSVLGDFLSLSYDGTTGIYSYSEAILDVYSIRVTPKVMVERLRGRELREGGLVVYDLGLVDPRDCDSDMAIRI